MERERHVRHVSGVLLPVVMLAALLSGALTAGPGASAGAVVLDFEDLWPGYEGSGTLPAGYGGFNWSNADWLTSDYYASSGYKNTIEGHVGIYTAWGNTLTMGGHPFNFVGCKLGAAWQTAGQGVTFQGKLGGVTIYSVHLVADYNGAYETLNFWNVDEVVIDPDTHGLGHQVVLDNVELCTGSMVIDFEDLWPGYETEGLLASPYHGFNWGNTVWLTKNQYTSNSGYAETIQGNVGILTPFMQAISMGGQLFTLLSCEIGAAWNDDQYVTIEGYRGGSLVVTDYFSPSYFGETHAFAGFVSVDLVTITPDLSTGTPHPGTYGSGHHVVLDDIAVAVPPATTLVAEDVSGNVGQTVQLSATLTAYGTPVPGQTIAFTEGAWSASAVTDAGGVAQVSYTIMSTGDKTYTADFAGSAALQPSSDDGTISAYNNVTGIGLFLSHNPVDAGDTTVATVVDKNGNIITAVANVYIQAGAGGSWAGNVYSSQKVGTWVVTATYGPLGDTENLVVNRGAVADVQISPDASTIASNQTQTYTVQASDGQGNTWAPDAAEVTWTTDGAGSFLGNTYTPDAADEGATVDNYATVDGVDSNHAALTVNPASGAGLILAWDKDDQNFYLCSNPADPQSADVAGLIPAANGAYTVNGVCVTVSGYAGNRSVTINNSHHVVNTLQVRWYLRGGAVSQAYMYSTIGTTKLTASYRSLKTYVDGQYKTGFWGLIHTPDAPDPTSITYGASEQP